MLTGLTGMSVEGPTVPGPFSENEAGRYRAPHRASTTWLLPLRSPWRRCCWSTYLTRIARQSGVADTTKLTRACSGAAPCFPSCRAFSQHQIESFGISLPARGPARGFVLTRETAELLADAAPPATDPWRRRVFALPPQGEGFGGVYVDVPHGALLISGTQQLRAIFAVPWWEEQELNGSFDAVRTEKVLVALVISGRGSEVPTGNAFAVVNAEDQVQVPLSPDRTLCHQLLPSAASSFSSFDEFYQLALVRSVSFLRLVMAYHEYGPAEARSVVRATPPPEDRSPGPPPPQGREHLFYGSSVGLR